jgi:aspartyl-tRNA(Asn)/glutamyl-tRNA(Gln) amidotransferase subunit A
MNLWELGPTDLTGAYRDGLTNPVEVVEASLHRIDSLDGEIGAFRQVAADRARAEAADLTRRLGSGEWVGPLHGVPVAVKELFDVAGAIGCYGSQVFADRVSADDAEVVRRLRAAGAIVIGVTRSHEFGWGITTQHASLGSTRNPRALDRVPGGSSGGSAAALATGMVPLAVGSDTGGSIRIPAAFCGVAGIKPTYGRVPKRGGVALAPSLDHPGPLARRATDLLVALEVMSGYDPLDASTLREKALTIDSIEGSAAGLVIGVAPDLHLTSLDESYEAAFDQVLRRLDDQGARLVEVAIPHAGDIRPTFGTIQMAEAYHYHNAELGTFPEKAADYGEDVRRRQEMSVSIDLSDFLTAARLRSVIRAEIVEVLSGVDAIVTPVSAGGPSKTTSPDRVEHLGRTIPFRDLVMNYTVPQDLVGVPAATVPVGRDPAGLPIGIQFTSAPGREAVALRAAALVESRLDVVEK